MKARLLAFPYLLWMALFVIIPLFLVLYYSLTIETGGAMVFSIDNFKRAFEPIYLNVFAKSMKIAALSTVICLILGYPVAYILASKEYSKKTVLFFLFVVPMWMNALLRTYSWITLLESNGAINTILAFFAGIFNGIFGTELVWKIEILYTDSAVLLGMVYNFLPFMILPIHTALARLDNSYVEAAQDLGANPIRVFFKVVFPLSIPGMVSGITMVFMPAVTTFVIPNLLGGGQYILIGNLIERQFLTLDDWHFGSAISFVLMIVILISMSILSIVDKNKDKETEGGSMI